MPKVSVILPNHNHARFLPRRLEGFLPNAWQDFEPILPDDASYDGSPGLLAPCDGLPKAARWEANRNNSGAPFRQWRKGMALAKVGAVWLAGSDGSARSLIFHDTIPDASGVLFRRQALAGRVAEAWPYKPLGAARVRPIYGIRALKQGIAS